MFWRCVALRKAVFFSFVIAKLLGAGVLRHCFRSLTDCVLQKFPRKSFAGDFLEEIVDEHGIRHKSLFLFVVVVLFPAFFSPHFTSSLDLRGCRLLRWRDNHLWRTKGWISRDERGLVLHESRSFAGDFLEEIVDAYHHMGRGAIRPLMMAVSEDKEKWALALIGRSLCFGSWRRRLTAGWGCLMAECGGDRIAEHLRNYYHFRFHLPLLRIRERPFLRTSWLRLVCLIKVKSIVQ